ncbi:unnamed protein product [Moneuplotes crassus]|uniref:Ubiquinol-cytochrome C reductase hinge domain-containing protein n=1 Tax=Euplotes crassus TaxID=5936 RepID=A0AAD2DA99_EUPCR|nr:unnamed protein product [Moneuplotes crassus]
MSEASLVFPKKNFYAEGSQITPDSNVSMLDRGVDPKPMLLELCKPNCHYWKHKLERCESKLAQVIKINPTKSCLYPMRDYVTCIEACVQPKIHNNLVGTERKYTYYD